MVVATVSWPGVSLPSTNGGADRGKIVDGRHKAGDDMGVRVNHR